MTEVKSWYQSRTIWGSLVVLGSTLANLIGIPVTPDDQQVLVEVITNGVAASGAVIAVFGRIAANSRIG